MSGRTLTIGLLALALVLRLGFVAVTPDYRPKHDDRDYDRLACAITTGGGYPRLPAALPQSPTSCRIPGQESARTGTAYRPPGLPYLLAGTYLLASPVTEERWLAGRVMLALLGVGVVWLAGLVATRIWGRRVGLLTLGLTALCPPLIIAGGSLLSEIPFTLLSLAAVLMMLERRERGSPLGWHLVAAGVFAGLAWLTRSNGWFLIGLLALVAWGPAPRLRAAAALPSLVLLLAAGLTVLPWTVRNQIVMRHFVPVDLSSGPTLAGTYNPTSLNDPVRPGAWRLLTQVPQLRPIVKNYAGNDVLFDAKTRAAGIPYVWENPEAPFIVGFNGLQRLFFIGGGGPRWAPFSVSVASQNPRLGRLVAISMWVYGLLALAGALTRAARRVPWWFWVVPASFLLTAALINSEFRFAVPFLPWLAMLGALAAVPLTRWRWTR